MKYCWSYSDSSGPIEGPCVILVGVLFLSRIHTLGELVLFSIVFVLALLWSYITSRKYQIDEHGITVRYPFGIRRKYPWSAISEVAICKIHYASKSASHAVGIRCAIGSESCVPSNAKSAREDWTSMTYEIMHFWKLITVYYTKERLEEFEKYYPSEIKDYRSLRDS